MKVKFWINGLDGRMGTAIKSLASTDQFADLEFSGGWSATEPLTTDTLTSLKGTQVIIDFSSPVGLKHLLDKLDESDLDPSLKLGIVVGTTGTSEEIRERLKKVEKVRVLEAPNTSLGVYWTAKASAFLAAPLTKGGFDTEIVETHHRYKQDAPSGTARLLLRQIEKALPQETAERSGYYDQPRKTRDIGMHALRGGGVYGEHEVRFLGDEEEIIVVHRARSRDLFARGALQLARWIAGRPNGYDYLMDVNLED